jgi:hypothetical protein
MAMRNGPNMLQQAAVFVDKVNLLCGMLAIKHVFFYNFVAVFSVGIFMILYDVSF